MRVIFHDNLRHPTSYDASRVVVYDDFGNAIAVAINNAAGSIYIGTVRDGDKFKKALHSLGIHQTVVVDEAVMSEGGVLYVK